MGKKNITLHLLTITFFAITKKTNHFVISMLHRESDRLLLLVGWTSYPPRRVRTPIPQENFLQHLSLATPVGCISDSVTHQILTTRIQ
ncbi:hypothetical protein [Nostoc sp. PA-18-2419]|uniref:hypothetical protein n=1 Tax=Nostoc sp. PA-18-2419 TaxID=2575443 RepID=UPI00167A79BE|nr:hypothetical protein [Nostoc sp. PA-18-2419]